MSASTLLIILALIIIGIGGLLFWLNSRLQHFFKIKIAHWLILIYAFVLLTASVVVPFMSKELTQLDARERQDSEKMFSEITGKLENGQAEKLDPRYILAEHSFDAEGQSLKITSYLESSPTIYVKRKNVSDGKIEAVIFQHPFIIDGADFSEVLEPYELTFEDNLLTIRSKQQSLRLSVMHSPFPVRQITNVSMMHHSSSRGEQLIYLQLPSGLELEDDENLFVRYVE